MKAPNLLLAIGMVFSIALLIQSCSKDRKPTSAIELLNEHSSAKEDACCSVTCRRGSCSVSNTPCFCSCIGGQPSCGSNASKIAIDSDQADAYPPAINYLNGLGTGYGDTAALLLESMVNLVYVVNNGQITNSEDIRTYDELVLRFIDIYNNRMSAVEQQEFDEL